MSHLQAVAGALTLHVVPEVNAFLLLVFASHGNHTQATVVGEYYMKVCGRGWGGREEWGD